jgi:hypothetical protein
MRVKQIGAKAASGTAQPNRSEQVSLAADADAIERHVGGEHFQIGCAWARQAMVNDLIGGRASEQPGEERFGTGHAGGGNGVQDAWGAAFY